MTAPLRLIPSMEPDPEIVTEAERADLARRRLTPDHPAWGDPLTVEWLCAMRRQDWATCDRLEDSLPAGHPLAAFVADWWWLEDTDDKTGLKEQTR